MLQSLSNTHFLSSNFCPSSLLPIRHDHHLFSHSLCPPHRHRPAPLSSISAAPRNRDNSWISQAEEDSASTSLASPQEGPIELPSSNSIFATTDDPTPLQIATSVLLTGAISVFLFRSIRRRVKRSKELRFRASGAKKTLKEEAIDSLKALGTASIESKSKSEPSPIQALLGGLTAGVIALILFKFTTTIEAALNRQNLSDTLSVRQITITVRTIVNGICYLATFVFGLNSIGLLLYSGQLAINSFSDDESSSEGSKGQPNSSEAPTERTEVSGVDQGDLKSDDKQ